MGIDIVGDKEELLLETDDMDEIEDMEDEEEEDIKKKKIYQFQRE